MTIVYCVVTSERVVPVGPIIGGDTYAHIGAIRSIRENWTPWYDQYYLEKDARAYSWFWHLLMAVFSLLIPLNILMLWSPLFFWILTLIAAYFAGKTLYGKTFGVFFAMFYFFNVDGSIINPNPKNMFLLLFFLRSA